MNIQQIIVDDKFDRCKVTLTLSGPEIKTINQSLHDAGNRSALRGGIYLLMELFNHGTLDTFALDTASAYLSCKEDN